MNACPCDQFIHPQPVTNPPGRATILYRVGNYTSFRRALLLAQADEQELINWRPSAQSDLALQMIEWWAYLADILTFYNERSANQSYLRTADLSESVTRLSRLLGYRPRPGIGAYGVVAALTSTRLPITLPAGFQIQSKPGPGQQPQIFELETATTLTLPDTIAAALPANPALLSNNSVLLKGAVTTIKSGDEVLLLQKGWQAVSPLTGYARVTVQQVQSETALGGATNTRLALTIMENQLPTSAQAASFRLLKSGQSARLYPFTADNVILANTLHLDALYRELKVGDPLILENGSNRVLVGVTAYTETIYYANAASSTPTAPPTAANVPAVPIPHSQPYFTPALPDPNSWNNNRSKVLVRFGWQEVGELIGTPISQANATTMTLMAAGSPFPVGDNQPILLEDAVEQGVAATATVNAPGAALQLAYPAGQPVALTPPLRALFNLLPVSRGQSVRNEILGSGDATLAGQEFVLQKASLTYLISTDPAASESYRSTLRVWVNGVEWQEASSFYDQPPDARIFVTREDEENKTHILFGDGVNGARLPSGVNNVVAQYRYGSGAAAPAANQLTVIVKPQPGLKAIRNPVAVGGGADPDPPEQIRRYAPQSVLTFGRAVSAGDYTSLAAQAPGVARARAYWAWDPAEQRTLVTVYVGDTPAAVTAARTALVRAVDPNRPFAVQLATPVVLRLSLALALQPNYLPGPVIAAVQRALLDPNVGLFGVNVVQIGKPLYRSEIFAACLSALGVAAVHNLQVFVNAGSGFALQSDFRFQPGEGKFFQVTAADLFLSTEATSDGR